MDSSKIKQQMGPSPAEIVPICSFCARELHPGERLLLTLDSHTGLSFVVHVQCFRAALSESNRYFFDNRDVIVY